MPAPCSIDLRRRVVAAVEDGATVRSVAERFGVAVSSVVKWHQRARATGTPHAKPMGGVRRNRLGAERVWILSRIVEKPDLTLRELLAELHARGVTVALNTLWLMLRREGLTFKKNADRERAYEARRRAAQSALDQALSAHSR